MNTSAKDFREEKDSLGTRLVPADAYYGIQSLRASENFKITGRPVHPEMIRSIIELKKASALVNGEVGAIQPSVAQAMVAACDEILQGKFRDQFITDAIQGGAGTSLNMNANEVIANRAIEWLGGTKGSYHLVHPNDHANCAQSTNDVYPSAGKIAAIRLLRLAREELVLLEHAFRQKANEYRLTLKMGRTEMQDAVPMTFGQVFDAFAAALSRDISRFATGERELAVINMGATAIGTGINASRAYIDNIVPRVAEVTDLPLVAADDLIDGTQNLDSLVHVSGILKACAVTLSKISSDLRMMSSGPRAGLGEITLPPRQNGSSIMPGKINPVVPEVMNQIAFNIIGNDTTITLAAESGQLELNAFEPVLFYRLFESLDTLRNGIRTLREDCVAGIAVNAEKCREDIERSAGIATSLCPYIGYTEAAAIAKRALREKKTIRSLLIEDKRFTASNLDEILDPYKMVEVTE